MFVSYSFFFNVTFCEWCFTIAKHVSYWQNQFSLYARFWHESNFKWSLLLLKVMMVKSDKKRKKVQRFSNMSCKRQIDLYHEITIEVLVFYLHINCLSMETKLDAASGYLHFHLEGFENENDRSVSSAFWGLFFGIERKDSNRSLNAIRVSIPTAYSSISITMCYKSCS